MASKKYFISSIPDAMKIGDVSLFKKLLSLTPTYISSKNKYFFANIQLNQR